MSVHYLFVTLYFPWSYNELIKVRFTVELCNIPIPLVLVCALRSLSLHLSRLLLNIRVLSSSVKLNYVFKSRNIIYVTKYHKPIYPTILSALSGSHWKTGIAVSQKRLLNIFSESVSTRFYKRNVRYIFGNMISHFET